MDTFDRTRSDLQYVRGVVVSANGHDSPATIYFLWAALVLSGFVLADVREAWVPAYWSVAAPAGFLVSAYLGWRHGRHRGQLDGRTRTVHLLHWGGMMVVAFLVALMPMTGTLAWDDVSLAILLVLSLGYFYAGLHLDRPFLWIGILMAIGYVWALFVTAFAWTALGAALAMAFIVAGLRERRIHAAAV